MFRPDGDVSGFYEDLDQLMSAARLVTAVVVESIADAEESVTLPQMRMLVLVASRPDVTAGRVADDLHIDPSNATRLIDRLVQLGYLRRSESRTDLRSIRLYLTPAGRHLVDDVMEHRRRAFGQIMRRMSVADRQRLAAALQAFAAAADEPAEFPSVPNTHDPTSRSMPPQSSGAGPLSSDWRSP